MPIFSFVILHYQTADDTIKCVDSIYNTVDYPKVNIVVVDNASPNNTGITIKEHYREKSNFTFIQNTANIGFAKGNNVGYAYAKHTLKSDFIAIINNDTFIEQAEFLSNIVDCYNKKSFHILGPDIISVKDKRHQNPRIETLSDPPVIRKFIRTYTLMYILSIFNLDLKAESLKKKIIPGSKLPSSNRDENRFNFKEEMENVKLHGSAVVYSPDFIKNYEYGFYPDTFIYCEESILNFIVKRDNLKTIYYPQSWIYHTEDSATDAVYRKPHKKRKFYYKNFIRSSRVLLKLMKERKNKER
ncbi:MAG: glycosyltransferase [Bacteroidales bacterium]|nr:glycosyltransferase [Bacteroidales bacterium]MDT8432411.1 glycosyltransferase [Bacteroidales bacterium]